MHGYMKSETCILALKNASCNQTDAKLAMIELYEGIQNYWFLYNEVVYVISTNFQSDLESRWVINLGNILHFTRISFILD